MPDNKAASADRTASSNSRRLGRLHEQRALRYLKRQGLSLLQANFNCGAGEIDLIMRDREGCVVFVEVRYRGNDRYGSAQETVGPAKQRKLRLAAAWFLNGRNWQHQSCRFDVVAITGGGPDQRDRLEWIRDAFPGA